MQEFVLEELLALADISLGRQDANGIIGKLISAIVGFASPDCQHHASRHAEFLFDARQRVAVLHGELLAAGGKTVEARFAQILRRRLHELGLLRSFLGLTWNGEIGQREVGFKPARETPIACAAGHWAASHCWKAASAASPDVVAANANNAIATACAIVLNIPPQPHIEKTGYPGMRDKIGYSAS